MKKMEEKEIILNVFECCKKHVKALRSEFNVERVVGCELRPSLIFDERKYALVDTIYYNEHVFIDLHMLPIRLYAEINESRISRSYLLYANERTPQEFNCPPEIQEILHAVIKMSKIHANILLCALFYNQKRAMRAWIYNKSATYDYDYDYDYAAYATAAEAAYAAYAAAYATAAYEAAYAAYDASDAAADDDDARYKEKEREMMKNLFLQVKKK